MGSRRNWLEPAVRIYLLCAVGTLVAGSLSGATWLTMIGGFLLGLALLTAAVASGYLFVVGRSKSASQVSASPPVTAGEDIKRG
jgi:hypothetical protein